jgi:hypothetical protein
MLCKSCRSAHKEDNKIGFAFTIFFTLYGFSKALDLFKEELRVYLKPRPYNFWTLHRFALGLEQGSLMSFRLHNCALRGVGDLVAGQVGPVQANV